MAVGRHVGKVCWGLLGVVLFVFALQVLKEGAGALGPLVRDTLRIDTAANALGFGWILAYVVLSGSPVAATAVTFFSEDVIDAFGAFAMIAGSRFGASFVVLVVGFVYALRARGKGVAPATLAESHTSLEMGVLSLLVTFAVYVPALAVGYFLLAEGWLAGYRVEAPAVVDAVDLLTTGPVDLLAARLPAWLLAAAGLALLVLALKVFDKALPQLSAIRTRTAGQRVFRPTVMFAIGLVVTFFTLSVSVSLGLLVPLAAKGYARRENVIPYIMGANISTFVDTLVAAVLVSDPASAVSPATIVLAEMLSVALVSAVVLFFAYRPFERAVLAASRAVLRSRRTLAAFVIAILTVPVALLLL